MRRLRSARIVTSAALFCACAPVCGQVVLDGSLGKAGAVSKVGNDYPIGPDVGRHVGRNLFHSFREFSIRGGESATFSSPDSVNNILARVTGGSVSTIHGKLSSTSPTANFFLINPAGVVFRPGAQVDVGGSFAVTTADMIRLSDGGVFHASDPAGSVLTTAPPSAFGFLGKSPGSIVIEGDAAANTELAVRDGNVLTVVGGDVSLRHGSLLASAGGINVASVRGGEVVIDAEARSAPVTLSPKSVSGNIVLADQSRIDASGARGGRVVIRGGQLRVEHSQVLSETRGAENGLPVEIEAKELLEVRGGNIVSITSSSGNSGDLRVSAGRVELSRDGTTQRFSGISNESRSGTTGAVGSLRVEAGEIVVSDGALILSNVLGEGAGGDVRVDAERIFLDGGNPEHISGIGVQGELFSSGDTGDLGVTAGRIDIVGNANISMVGRAAGNIGDIDVEAERIHIDGTSLGMRGLINIAVSGSDGRGGGIRIGADDITIKDGGVISTTTFGSGDGGSIDVRARHIHIDGAGAPDAFTGIAADTINDDGGNAGDLVLDVGRLELYRGGKVSASTYASGNAGSVTIRADSILADVDDSDLATGIQAEAKHDATGNGGSADITVGSLTLLSGAWVSTSNFGQGTGGDLNVSADSIRIERRWSDRTGGIGTQSGKGASGDSGDVTVRATTIDMIGGEITMGTFGAGNAGDLTVVADHISIEGEEYEIFAGIGNQSTPDATGDSGNVRVEARLTLRLTNGGTISAATFSQGRSGKLDVVAGEIYIEGGDSPYSMIASDTVGEEDGGDAGHLTITADTIRIVDGGAITAGTWGDGNGGDLTINAREIIIDGMGSEYATGIFVTSDDGATGKAGSILISAQLIDMRDGQIATTASADGGDIVFSDVVRLRATDSSITLRAESDGGRITIDPEFLILNNTLIDGESGGDAVELDIDDDAIFFDAGSDILIDMEDGPDALDIEQILLVLAQPNETAVASLRRRRGPVELRLEPGMNTFMAAGPTRAFDAVAQAYPTPAPFKFTPFGFAPTSPRRR